MRRLRVRWSPSASSDFIEILEFISRDQPAAARKAGRRILSAAASLGRNPRQGRTLPELWEHGIPGYREIVIPPYRIIYAIRADCVDVLAVLDGRRDLMSLLLQRLMR